MMENTKNPSKMRGENWKFRWRRQCLAKKGQGQKRTHRARLRKLKGEGVRPTRFKKKKKTCMYRGSAWVYETTSGIFSAEKSRGPHCRQRIFLDDPFHSDAASNGNSRCKSSSGQGMEEARDNSCLAVGKSQKARRRLFWKHIDGRMSPQERGVRSNISEVYKSESYSEDTL